jgi:hypothetical protein
MTPFDLFWSRGLKGQGHIDLEYKTVFDKTLDKNAKMYWSLPVDDPY